MNTNLQIKSNLSIDDLIGDLSQLDTSTLDYLIHSLQTIRLEKEETSTTEQALFWQLIKKIDWSKDSAEERLKPLLETLKEAEVDTINKFSEQLAQALHRLDGPAYYEVLKSREQGVSADTFLYARCFVVAKGNAFFEMVLQHPEKMMTAENFEAILYLTQEAYQQKTGEAYNFFPSVVYESFFNEKLWKEKAISL